MEAGATSDSFAPFWDDTPHTELSCPALTQGEVLSYHSLMCHVWLISMRSLPFSEQKWGMSGWGREEEKEG